MQPHVCLEAFCDSRESVGSDKLVWRIEDWLPCCLVAHLRMIGCLGLGTDGLWLDSVRSMIDVRIRVQRSIDAGATRRFQDPDSFTDTVWLYGSSGLLATSSTPVIRFVRICLVCALGQPDRSSCLLSRSSRNWLDVQASDQPLSDLNPKAWTVSSYFVAGIAKACDQVHSASSGSAERGCSCSLCATLVVC